MFQSKNPNLVRIVKAALNFGRDFIIANSMVPEGCDGRRSPPPSSIRWSPPKPSFVELNFDGCVVNQGAAAGFVIGNEKGEPIIVGTSCDWK